MHWTWLHMPKCGSTFATLLIRVLCGVKLDHVVLEPAYEHLANCSVNSGHTPLKANPAHAITVLRHPASRITSGFLHNLHDLPTMQQEFGIQQDAGQKEWLQVLDHMNDTQLNKTFRHYAQQTQCCYIRMLLGQGCGGECPQSQMHAISTALNTLSRFHFVGIMELWMESIHAFAELHGTHARDIEMSKGRVTPNHALYSRIFKLALHTAYPDDHLYAFAIWRLTSTVK